MHVLASLAATLGATALASASSSSSCTKVKTGLDLLIASDYAALQGRKVLVLTNPTGVTPELDLGVDVMVASGKVDLVGVMGPSTASAAPRRREGGSRRSWTPRRA